MERELRLLKFETFHKAVETIPVPVKAYGCFHEDNRDVIVIYLNDNENKAA